MLTIFLVEDEFIELDLLQNHIDWASMNIRVVGAAKNGKKAWEQIQHIQPDIVLTDVRMPIMDGLQPAALIQERFDWMKIIFLSGHDEFIYVKSALHAGAVGYLLKPINPIELHAVLAKVKEEVEKVNILRRSRQILIEKHIEDIYKAANNGSVEQSWTELILMDQRFLNDHYVTALISIDNYFAYKESPTARLKNINEIPMVIRSLLGSFSLEGITLRVVEHEWLLTVKFGPGIDYELFWQDLSESIRREYDWTVTIGIADTVTLLKHAHSMFKEAEKAVGERFYTGLGNIIHSGQVKNERDAAFNSEDEMLLGGLHLSDLTAFLNGIDHYFDTLVRMHVKREKAYEVSMDVLKGIASVCAKFDDQAIKGIGGLHDWNRSILQEDSIRGIKDFILGLMDKISRYLENKQQDRHMLLVQEVVDIIDSAYFEPLTIEHLAEKVYISPNYLRALFKEKKGCTIHEYLTKVRLTMAVELLRDKSLKIHDVARKVGYDNSSYFSSFFYKTQGVTPNEYRKKFL
ncbi:response regulator [Paenibacillus sp. PL91]|uniref:response regulator transcription factor n=1 Tax=Paenibacillus sp. PL91 TaxID=2729538 RepID=UPI00145E908B|nr:response regulator [Paenibacillus sp. PL91]MBC9199169.1 response regulator [Paenibacillus sp. PL91]